MKETGRLARKMMVMLVIMDESRIGTCFLGRQAGRQAGTLGVGGQPGGTFSSLRSVSASLQCLERPTGWLAQHEC
jgi:hypothetical protein